MSQKAEKDAFEFDNGRSIENEKAMFFDDYKNEFSVSYKHKVSTLKSIRSAAIACSIGIMTAFMIVQGSDTDARKEEEPEEAISQGSYQTLTHQK